MQAGINGQGDEREASDAGAWTGGRGLDRDGDAGGRVVEPGRVHDHDDVRDEAVDDVAAWYDDDAPAPVDDHKYVATEYVDLSGNDNHRPARVVDDRDADHGHGPAARYDLDHPAARHLHDAAAGHDHDRGAHDDDFDAARFHDNLRTAIDDHDPRYDDHDAEHRQQLGAARRGGRRIIAARDGVLWDLGPPGTPPPTARRIADDDWALDATEARRDMLRAEYIRKRGALDWHHRWIVRRELAVADVAIAVRKALRRFGEFDA